MPFAVSPRWWPLLAGASPVLAPMLAVKAHRFRDGQAWASVLNDERTRLAAPLELPALKWLEVVPLVEQRSEVGFAADAGVSYWIRSDRGSVLFDLAWGASRPALCENARRLGFTLRDVDAVFVSHLHPDHAGGIQAARTRQLAIPDAVRAGREVPLHAPVECSWNGLRAQVTRGPKLVEAGLATTGPLARMLFFEGMTEEQALLARVEGKGLVMVTGCGHPGVGVLLAAARRLSSEPIHALVGGLHLPVTASRIVTNGVEWQRLLGTGKPPWRPISDADVSRAIARLNRAGVRVVLASAHDSCEHALARMMDGLAAERVEVLRAGATYRV